MNARPNEPTALEGTPGKAVLLGLRLDKGYPAVAFSCFYALGFLIFVIVFFVSILLVLLGKIDGIFDEANPVLLYSCLLPITSFTLGTWVVKLVSRVLWCAVQVPRTATILAVVSLLARLAVLFAVGYLWLSGVPFGKGLFLPGIVACAAFAWIGLVAEWRFIVTLRRHFVPTPDPHMSCHESENVVDDANKPEGVTDGNEKSNFTGNFVARFNKLAAGRPGDVFILLVIAYAILGIAYAILVSGTFQDLLAGIVIVVVTAPVLLQLFPAPGDGSDGLIDALSGKPSQESEHST